MDDNSLQPRAGVSSAASVPAAAAGQAEKTLGEAGDAVQQAARQAWSQAGDVADNMLSAGPGAAQAASRHVEEQPLLSMIVGFVLGYIAALLVHGRR
jgi:hypothetical protein